MTATADAQKLSSVSGCEKKIIQEGKKLLDKINSTLVGQNLKNWKNDILRGITDNRLRCSLLMKKECSLYD